MSLRPPRSNPVTGRVATVHVAHAPVLHGAALDAARLRLDATERTEAHRRGDTGVIARYVTGRTLLRALVADHTGIPPVDQRWTRRCRVCGGPHGTPVLLGPAGSGSPLPHVSVSATTDRVVVALAAVPVGVDVEDPTGADFAGFEDVALTATERAASAELAGHDRARARATTWTRKEALLKATGHGLRVDPAHVGLTPPDGPPALREWRDPHVPRPDVALADLDLPDGTVGAVAALGADTVDVRAEGLRPPGDAPGPS